MKLGYVILYVPDVGQSLGFFSAAFGLETRFLHESGTYGELESGATTLAFASHELGQMNMKSGYIAASDSKVPLGMEIALVTEDVAKAHARALAAGASEIAPAVVKPWGQTVSYVRAPDGCLVEICSPVG